MQPNLKLRKTHEKAAAAAHGALGDASKVNGAPKIGIPQGVSAPRPSSKVVDGDREVVEVEVAGSLGLLLDNNQPERAVVRVVASCPARIAPRFCSLCAVRRLG